MTNFDLSFHSGQLHSCFVRRTVSDITTDPIANPIVRPVDILSGIGTLRRTEICQMIALIECVDGLFLAKGAVAGIGAQLGMSQDFAVNQLQAAQDGLFKSSATNGDLRFRLWTRFTEAMAVPSEPPLSTRAATKTASAFAVRAAERLTPSIKLRHGKTVQEKSDADLIGRIGSKTAGYWKAVKTTVRAESPMPFPEIVAEELLALLADDAVVDSVAQNADPEIVKALREGQTKARTAIAAGGVWVGGAAVVANAGFFPYIIAAQLSAFIPMVSGPALVSLLATLINPVTVFAGVAALGWIGMGRGSRVVRSQVASRLGVMLAAQGTQNRDIGLEQFLTDMRALDRTASDALRWMSATDRSAMRRRLSTLTTKLSGPLPAAAGAPPEPWETKRMSTDVTDASMTFGMTAGEMIWHAAAVDHNVMMAADFSRSEDLGNPIAFACRANEFLIPGASWSLRGYTAERLVMDQLIADGHDVNLAEASNTPGLDLLVDGQPVQVKCGTALSNLTEHFEKYPDIPVIANAALAEKAAQSDAPWAHLVTTVPGFEIETLEEQIAETLGHAADLADPDILQFALSISALRGGLEVMQGRVPISDLPAWLLLDGASRGALALVGGKAGAWIGLIAIGPAGALILGPAIGSAALLGNSTLKGAAQKHLMTTWLQDLLSAAQDLHLSLLAALERRIIRIEERNKTFVGQIQRSKLEAWLALSSQDDLIALLEDRYSLEAAHPKSEADAIELLFTARDIAPTDATVLGCVRVLEDVLVGKPNLKTAMIDAGRPAADAIRSRLKGT
ncbi:hypothetical protein [Cognatishimia sp.]|uniref:hypothetical protein n=1 Tax=Cognatishimia sp. TaxID=2211648 RepID=UPI00351284FF|nr:hypothetical protein [Cognatishimia sp.]